MRTDQAIKLIADFKGDNLKTKLNDLKVDLIGKKGTQIKIQTNLFEAALIVKKVSAQIDEIVHAIGIINCLPKILTANETVVSLSLAAGADGDGIDLVTNKRIAEFKFAKWQDGKAANGMRKRQVFADCINLYLSNTTKTKELYVYDAERILEYFNSKKACWKNVLSKSGGLDLKLDDHLKRIKISGEKLGDVYVHTKVKIVDIATVIS